MEVFLLLLNTKLFIIVVEREVHKKSPHTKRSEVLMNGPTVTNWTPLTSFWLYSGYWNPKKDNNKWIMNNNVQAKISIIYCVH